MPITRTLTHGLRGAFTFTRNATDAWLVKWYEIGFDCAFDGERVPIRSIIAWHACHRTNAHARQSALRRANRKGQ